MSIDRTAAFLGRQVVWLAIMLFTLPTGAVASLFARKQSDQTAHSYVYEDVDRRTRATLADNSAWNYDYTDRNEVVAGKRTWADFSPVSGQQFGYAYDNIGNRTTAKSGGDVNGQNLRTTVYATNALNQYTQILTPGYKDIVGVALATSEVTVNGLSTDRKAEYFHRELTFNNTNLCVWQNVAVAACGNSGGGNFAFPPYTANPTYDLDGNLTFDGVWNYGWNAENQLIEMWMTDVSGIPNAERKRLQFQYDYLGRRVSKTVSTWNGAGFGGPVTTYFVYDGWNLVGEIGWHPDNLNYSRLLRSYVWGRDLSGALADTAENAGGIGGLVLLTDYANGTICCPTYDGNGNVTALVNATDATIAAQYEYSPFGELIRADGSMAKPNPFRFSTKYWDEETGLVYYGERFYSPITGRFINRDPIEEEGGNNLYSFTANDPICYIDIHGKLRWKAIWGTLEIVVNTVNVLLGGGSLDAMKTGGSTVGQKMEEGRETATKTQGLHPGGKGKGGKGKPKKVHVFKGSWDKAKKVARSPKTRALAAIGTVYYIVSGQAEADAASFANNVGDYYRHEGDQGMADLDAAMVCIDALNMFGNTAVALSIWDSLTGN